MELKKNEETDEKLVDLDSMFDSPKADTVSKDFRKYTDDYSRSSSNIGYAGTALTDWDDTFERNAFQMSQKQMEQLEAPTAQDIKKERNGIVRASMVLVIASYAYLIFRTAMITSKDPIDIYFNLPKLITPAIIVIVCMCFDALMVNMFEDRAISLFFFALFLGIFYPFYRCKVVGGTLLPGLSCSLLALFAAAMLFTNIGQQKTKYGKTIYVEDEEIRHSAYEVLIQEGDNNREIGLSLQKKLDIESVTMEDKKDGRYITFIGTGKLNIDNLGVESGKHTPTEVIFLKEKESDKYTFYHAKMNGGDLTTNQDALYWETIEKVRE